MVQRGSLLRSPEVSCRNIGWCFDLCAERKLAVNRVLGNIPYTREHMQNPACFIDWESFSTFNNNFLLYFSESEFREAGRQSWQARSMRIYRIIGNLLYNVREQFTSAYGPMGFVAKLHPCELTLKELYAGHLKIRLRMKPGLTPCRSFHLSLAGQMEGLPESLGYNDANVQLHHHAQGADFDVYYQPHGGFFAPFRRLLARPFTIRDSAVELNLTSESLLQTYRDLQTDASKIDKLERRASEIQDRYALLADNVSDVIWTTDLDLNLEYLSPSMSGLTGYNKDETNKIQIRNLFNKDTIADMEEYIHHSLNKNTDPGKRTFESQICRKDGSKVWVKVKSSFVLNESGRPCGLVGIARDISDRKRREEELNRREANYRAIADTAGDAIFTFDDAGIITFANLATARTFGYRKSQMLGLPVKAIVPGAFNSSPAELQQLSNSTILLAGITQNKNNITLEISFAMHEQDDRVSFTVIARDISERSKDEQERNQLQSQLLASQKMESIGQLTGGIAHDFNNLLVAINGYAELGLSEQSDKQHITHCLSEIKLAGERAADMTQKLLAFSRRQIIEPSVLNLCELVDGLKLMIQRLLPENIDIEFCNLETPLNIFADGGQMEQILVNLAVNARDAMPGGGKLTISCDTKTIDEAFSIQHTYTQPGSYVVVVVSDTGTGMSEDVQQRIFEPFFTTKPEGSGTGLGMAVVFGIIKQHDGFIVLDSKIDVGSTFSVYLPMTDKSTAIRKKLPEPKIMGGTENILVVEDNRQVRDIACIILKDAGYQVFAAVDGIEATKKFRYLASKLDLVVMDVVMPKMGGREVLEKMRMINPNIKVIFTSGYSSSGIHTNFILEQGLEFVKKPYHSALLLRKVRQILDKNDVEVA